MVGVAYNDNHHAAPIFLTDAHWITMMLMMRMMVMRRRRRRRRMMMTTMMK